MSSCESRVQVLGTGRPYTRGLMFCDITCPLAMGLLVTEEPDLISAYLWIISCIIALPGVPVDRNRYGVEL